MAIRSSSRGGGGALSLLHRVPRVINLLCEHCLVSSFVDQKKTVSAEIVDAVAKDFDLSDVSAWRHDSIVPPVSSERFDLVEALRTLATLADRSSIRTRSPQREETMSRIHDALKRAEQERQLRWGTR